MAFYSQYSLDDMDFSHNPATTMAPPAHGETMLVAMPKPSLKSPSLPNQNKPRDESRARRSVHFGSLPEKHYAPVTTKRRQRNRHKKMNNNFIGRAITKKDLPSSGTPPSSDTSESSDSAATTPAPPQDGVNFEEVDLRHDEAISSSSSDDESQPKRSPSRIRADVLAQIAEGKVKHDQLQADLDKALQLAERLKNEKSLLISACNRDNTKVRQDLETELRKERERHDTELRKERERHDTEREKHDTERQMLETELRKVRQDLETELRKEREKRDSEPGLN